jgi:hypothetical protein
LAPSGARGTRTSITGARGDVPGVRSFLVGSVTSPCVSPASVPTVRPYADRYAASPSMRMSCAETNGIRSLGDGTARRRHR